MITTKITAVVEVSVLTALSTSCLTPKKTRTGRLNKTEDCMERGLTTDACCAHCRAYHYTRQAFAALDEADLTERSHCEED